MRRCRWLILPLSVYAAVALGVPVLNGAWQRAAFWEHATVVLLAMLAFVCVAGAVGALVSVCARIPARNRPAAMEERGFRLED